MESYQVYTACLIQPVVKWVYKRSQLTENLERYLKLIDGIARRAGGWAPLKLFAFPEFFLQGYTTRSDIDMKYYREEILITLPGEESDLLGAKAKEFDVYILGCALEHDPKLPEYFFNSAFVISPEGEIIHKYRKVFPFINTEMAMSPHDILDRYLEVYGQGKNVIETVFPVTDTPLGRIGTYICMDGHLPEVARALALQGAEILVRPTAFPVPLVFPPLDTWELQNRIRAHENMTYVLAPNTGGQLTEELPEYFTPGDTMVVDYNGMIVARAPYPGETVVCAEIHLEDLRRRRLDPRRNFLTQIRTEVFRDLYKEPIYPKNLFLKNPMKDRNGVLRKDCKPIIEAFIQKGVFVKPE